jgi:hypothetical protein
MEQRRLRLGDILDDYCPRERRVTNHAVVAMIEENVKQTRCTTCDAEHPYKGGQAPRRRKKETSSSLYKEVLAGKPDTEEPVLASSIAEPESSEIDVVDEFETPDMAAGELTSEEVIVSAEAPEPVSDVEDGPVHRPLIRATLPRPEGQKDSRPIPDFTIRQSGGRGNAGNSQFRGNNNRMKTRGGHGGNGHRPQGGPRFPGHRSGQGRGHGGGGFRSAQQPRHGGGRKRSR